MPTANASGQVNTTQSDAQRQQSTPSSTVTQQQFSNTTALTFEGNTTIGDQEVYEFTANISDQQLQEMLPQQQRQGMAAMAALQDLSYTVYVTHEDHYLERITADATTVMQGNRVNVDVQVTLDDFNENVTIDLPDAATNAQPIGMG